MIEYFAVLITTFILWFVWRRYRLMTLRDRLGIPGPKAHFFFGNLPDFIQSFKKCNQVYPLFLKWRKQYGNVYGIYFGPTLYIVVNDLEMSREILIKQFSSFEDRPPVPFIAHKPLSKGLTILKGDEWKNVRNLITPTFTTAKLKQMSEAVDEKIMVFINTVEQHERKKDTFNIYDPLQGLTLDIIGKCAFAMDVKSQTDPNDSFLKAVQIFFQQFTMQNSIWLRLSLLFPEFNYLISLFRPISKTGVVESWIFSTLRKVIDARRKILKEIKSVDVLQVLLEQNETASTSETSKQSETWKVSDSVLEANIFLFLIAGYETTSTALAYTIWLLAKYPNVQKRLQEEIDEKIRSKTAVNYETVQSMPYMDAVFRESLRYYPPVVGFTSRLCKRACNIHGTNFVPGTVAFFLPRLIHHDPNIWPNPEEFNPERFSGSKDYDSMAWMPFGIGPRNCVGMRFADMEAKMCLFKLFSKYNVEMGLGSEDPIEVQEIDFIMRPKNGVFVKVTKRA